jgi:hypothetical protein
MYPASPQRDALLKAPTLDLTLPEALDGQRQEDDSKGGEEGEVDSKSDSVDSDGEEEKAGEESSDVEEEEKSKDWADQVEEEATNEAKAFRSDIREALFKEKNEWSKEAAKDFVKGLKLWEDLKPRRVQALCACAGRNETHLSFKAGAVMDGARPAAWLEDDWLEATLDGRDGLVFQKYVKYLPDLPK